MVPDTLKDLHFPRAGLFIACPYMRQPNLPIDTEVYARTTRQCLNVRGYEPQDMRNRGGSREGLSKYIASPVVAGWIIQELNVLVGTNFAVTGGSMGQFSQSGRVVGLIAVSQGNVYAAFPGATSFTEATNSTGNSPPLNFTGIVYSYANQQKLWFADGVNYAYYDPTVNTVFPWIAATQDLDGNPLTVNVLPVDSAGNTPRLICTWRGRTVLSGLLLDPDNWFMSAVDDPRNFCYLPNSQTALQAVAGNNGPQGLVGDVITSLCPYTDDVLIFFGDHSIYMMTGDPLAGGQLQLVTNAVGGVWGVCWCMDPYGTIYFISNRTGVYSYVPGQQPQRISQAIESFLIGVDTGLNNFRLMWDDRFQGFHLFISPLLAPGVTQHLFYDQRLNAWFPDQYGSTNYDPLCCVVYDGNTPGDRVPLIGSWDGYVRAIDPAAVTDDGIAISSSVVIGPMLTPNFDEILMKDLQGILGETSGTVNWAVYVGTTAEEALSSTARATGTFQPGLNYSAQVRAAGHAVYVELTSTNSWAMEAVKVRLATQGKVRMRGK